MSVASVNGSNVFDPESLVEVIKVSGKELRVRPLPLKTVRRLVATVQEIVLAVTSGSDGAKMSDVFTGVLDRQHDVLPIVFPRDQYEWMTKEWVEDNVSVPVLRHVADRLVRVNGLESLLPFMLKGEAAPSQAKIGA